MLKLIPRGFPVRLDIPLFYVFTARVTFQNINEEGDFCQKGESWKLKVQFLEAWFNLSPKDADGKLKIDDKVFRIPGEYQQEHRNLQDTISEHRRNRRDTNFDDIELNAAIEESLKELGVSNDPATRRQIIETQRQGIDSSQKVVLFFSAKWSQHADGRGRGAARSYQALTQLLNAFFCPCGLAIHAFLNPIFSSSSSPFYLYASNFLLDSVSISRIDFLWFQLCFSISKCSYFEELFFRFRAFFPLMWIK